MTDEDVPESLRGAHWAGKEIEQMSRAELLLVIEHYAEADQRRFDEDRMGGYRVLA